MSAAHPTGDTTILVVEDEPDILDVVAYNLQRAGFQVERAADGNAGLRAARRLVPDLVVLDVMMPGIDGIEVCRSLRRESATAHIPVLMLTAKGDEADIVTGLDAGADDYLAKPFGPRELVARVRALLRRGGQPADADAAQRIRHGEVIVDPIRHEVLVAGDVVRFTRTEFRLLHALAAAPGRAYSRDQLVTKVMGDDAWITDRTIDVHIRAVRKKLGAHAAMIETVRGVGYRFNDALVPG